MPRKGFPRCKFCRYYAWRLIKHGESDSLIECTECGKRVRTRSNRRHELKRTTEPSQ